MFRSLIQVAFGVSLFTLVLSIPVEAQQNVSPVGSEYIPSDAVATTVITVAETLQSPALEMYPTEVLEAWTKTNVGVPASQIDQVKIVVGVPGPAGPMGALIATLRQDLDLQSINQEIVDTSATVEIDGHDAYMMGNGQLVMHLKDARTVVIATTNYLDTVLRAGEGQAGSGALSKLAANIPHRGAMTFVLAIEPVRPMINGMVQMNSEQIPPPFQPFTKIPDLLEAVFIQVNPSDSEQPIKSVMLARDEASAEEMMTIINDGLELGKQIFLAKAMQDIEGDDEVAEATRQYMQRLADYVAQSLRPEQNGRRLNMNTSFSGHVASQGVLIGLLLPAVQAARQAARRMESSNNLKQIGLAIHNYHSAYRKMPGNIVADDGTPLLSWRVAILPFIEEQPLYEKFNLDEPWDSPNNRPLLDQMPPVYIHPGIVTEDNQTVYQRPVGETFLTPTQELKFRDIIDGLSNTIMVLETPREAAVNWSQPEDISLPPDNALDQLRNERKQGFHALFADGAVKFIANSIDPEVLKSLLTRNGKEPVNFD